MKPIFDCFKEEYKKPFGAIERETECRFTIKFPEDTMIEEPMLVMFRPGYKERFIKLEKGDTLFLYTDGLVEATNTEDEMFGAKRALKHLNDTKDAPPEIILDHMKNAVKGFVGEAMQFDDLTMLALKLNK